MRAFDTNMTMVAKLTSWTIREASAGAATWTTRTAVNKNLLKERVEQLDAKATHHVDIYVRRTERQNWGASAVDVAGIIYSPPRMTAIKL